MDNVLLLDGPRNGEYATPQEGFASGYVYDSQTSSAWSAVSSGEVMVYASHARELEAEWAAA